MTNWIGRFGALWGATGVLGLLGWAVVRLSPRAWEAYLGGLTTWQWAITVLVCLFMAYAEGYRGFQMRYSPRTAARIRYLRDEPNLIRTLLAPLFVMGFFHAGRRTRIVAWVGTLLIIAAVIVVQALAQPWRGIVDAGVVLGLSWGIVSLVLLIGRALTSAAFPVSPDVP